MGTGGIGDGHGKTGINEMKKGWNAPVRIVPHHAFPLNADKTKTNRFSIWLGYWARAARAATA